MGTQDPDSSGQALARLRMDAGLSLLGLADLAGIGHTTLSEAERGRPVTREVLTRLASVLGADVYAVVKVDPRSPETLTKLAQARRAAGLTQAAAAERAGVTLDTFKRAERGSRPHPRNAKKMADAFGLNVADVLPFP